jgi:hypothetical protein
VVTFIFELACRLKPRPPSTATTNGRRTIKPAWSPSFSN